MIAGIAIGLIVLGAGGYFAYTKFMGPKEPGTEVAQTQPTPGGADAGTPVASQIPQGSPETAPPETAATPGQPSSASPQTSAYPPATQSGVQPRAASGNSTSRQQAPAPQQPAYVPPQQQTPSSTPVAAPPSAPPPRPPAQPVEDRQPILRPERTYPPAPVTQTPSQTAVPPAATAARYTGPSSGMLMWSGKLDKNAVVTINGSSASSGTLTGTLPGVPVTIETDLTNIGFAETPSPSNGWKKVSLRSKKNQNIVVNIRWRVID